MSKGVLDLGCELVKELDIDPGADTLSRWMAHYIAELIDEAKTAKVEDRPAKLARCADAILKLWDHRHQLPDGKRPFEDLEPIMRALASLDPADDTPRFYRTQRMAINKTKESKETAKWLDLADGLDYSAKNLIRYCLAQAAQTALDKSKAWVKLAEKAGLEDNIDFRVIRFTSDEKGLSEAQKLKKMERRQLEDRIKRLDGFKKMADSLASDLRLQLKQSKIPKSGS
mgnify:CR=1 FL=1